jgi:SAM-dependent methyltransferase
MDYDKTEIPTTYDKARALAPETLRLWQDLLSVHTDRADMSLVIDLGCGTGRFSEILAAHFGVQVIGIDPSFDARSYLSAFSCLGRFPVIPHRECPILACASEILLRNATSTLSIEKSRTPVRGLRSKSRPLVIRFEFAIPFIFRERFLSIFHSFSS